MTSLAMAAAVAGVRDGLFEEEPRDAVIGGGVLAVARLERPQSARVGGLRRGGWRAKRGEAQRRLQVPHQRAVA